MKLFKGLALITAILVTVFFFGDSFLTVLIGLVAVAIYIATDDYFG